METDENAAAPCLPPPEHAILENNTMNINRIEGGNVMQPVVEYRRALHRIPELDDRLPETCAYVQSALASFELETFSPSSTMEPTASCPKRAG